MTYKEVQCASLPTLVAFLTEIYEDCQCPCRCKAETYYESCWNGHGERWAKEDERKCKKEGRFENCPERLAFERVMDAVKKQIPKKPNVEEHHNYCPTCGQDQEDESEGVNVYYDYCFNCGQRLDWSDL